MCYGNKKDRQYIRAIGYMGYTMYFEMNVRILKKARRFRKDIGIMIQT